MRLMLTIFLFSASALLAVFPGTTFASPGLADGGVSLSQTRVIFNATDKAQVLKIKNSGQERYLIQSRVLVAAGEAASAPFVVIPPLFTLQPESHQQLRIVSQGGALPEDRESLFFLSILAIPAQQTPDMGVSKVSMGIRFGLKLFYRPTELGTGPQACSLQVRALPDGVLIENPTPFFQTFGQLKLNNIPVNLDIQASMLKPYGSQHYPMGERAMQAEWQTINDYGALAKRCDQILSSVKDKTS